MADRASAYADWLVANQAKKGTPEFETVAAAYKQLRANGDGAPSEPNMGFGTRDQREQDYSPEQMQAASREADVGARVRNIQKTSAGQGPGQFVRGATFGLMDELMSAPMGAVKTAGDYLTKGKSVGLAENISREREAYDRAQKDYAEQNPVTATALQVAGGIAPGGSGLPTATGLLANTPGVAGTLARTAEQGVIGAGYGAAQGFGEGDTLESRMQGAKSGAMWGAPFAAGGNLVAEGIGAGARTAMRALNPTEGDAARVLQKSINNADQMRATEPFGIREGMSPEDIAKARADNQPVMLADRGGTATRELARMAANQNPEAAATLNREINSRFEQQGQRTEDVVNRLFPNDGLNPTATLDKLTAKGRAFNKANYDAAHANPAADSMWDPELQRLTGSSAVQDAIRDVAKKASNRAIAEGAQRPVKNPFVVGNDGALKLKQVLRADGTRESVTPNLAFWDNVKRNLDDMVDAARGGEQRDLKMVRNALRDHLDRVVPEYGVARKGAASVFGAENAYEAGAQFAKRMDAIKSSDAMAALGKMSGSERALFARSFAAELVNQIRNTADRRSVLNNPLFTSGAGRQKLQMALGKNRAEKLTAFMRREAIMDELRPAVQGNSSTVRQMITAGLLGGGGYAWAQGDMSPETLLSGAAVGAVLGKAKAHLADRAKAQMAGHIADLLTAKSPDAIQRAIERTAADPAAMRRLQQIHESLVQGTSRNVGTSELLPAL